LVKKTITYMNPFTEKMVTEEHYFHISKADLVEMEMEEHAAKYEKDGETFTGMRAHLQKIVDSEDGRAVLREFKAILRRAYGKKEGDRFVKNDEVWREFEGSEAYSELIFELLTNPEELGKFTSSIVPSNIDQIAAEVAARSESETVGSSVSTPQGDPMALSPLEPTTVDRKAELSSATPQNPVTLTRAEMEELNGDILKSGLADGRFKLS
jgi:hypothetical protein